MCNQLSILCDAILTLLNFLTKLLRFYFQLFEFFRHSISEFLGTKACISIAKHCWFLSYTCFERQYSNA